MTQSAWGVEDKIMQGDNKNGRTEDVRNVNVKVK